MENLPSNNKTTAQVRYPEQGYLNNEKDNQITSHQDVTLALKPTSPNQGRAKESSSNMTETTDGNQKIVKIEYEVPTLFGKPPTQLAIQAYKDAINELFCGPGEFTLISSKLEGVRCIFRKKGFRKEFAVVDSLATAEKVCSVSRTAIVIIHEPGSHKELDTDVNRISKGRIGDALIFRALRKDFYLFRNMGLTAIHASRYTNTIWRNS